MELSCTRVMGYPESVDGVLDERTFAAPLLDAVRAMEGVHKLAPKKQRERFRRLHSVLCLETSRITNLAFCPTVSGDQSYYTASGNTIVLCGEPWLPTYLHEFGHALGYDEREACAWSLNLFRRVFPREFATLRRREHQLLPWT